MTKRTHSPHLDDGPTKKTHRDYTTEDTRIDESSELTTYLNDQDMIKQLKRNGFNTLFPVQQAAYKPIFKGRDLTTRDRTGSGKTLAYLLPSLMRLREANLLTGNTPKILVMLPTRELAIQVKDCMDKLSVSSWNIRTVAVYGGDPMWRQMDNMKRGVDVMVATPGRLNDFINRGVIRFDSLKIMILDQADEMLKQGFKEQIEKIFQAVRKDTKDKIQTLLFSATIPSWVKSISDRYQERNTEVIDLIGSTKISVPKTIKHYQYPIRGSDQIGDAVKRICRSMSSSEGRCIFFCETKREVGDLCRELRNQNCKALHGDIGQSDRERIYRDFKSGKVTKVVATNVAARGLDFPDIELVVQVEPPKNVESYIHRAGRTGRAGKQGKSVLLVQRRYGDRLRNIERQGGFRFEELRDHDLR